MKKPIKLLSYNVALLSLVLLLVGCAEDKSKEVDTNTSDDQSVSGKDSNDDAKPSTQEDAEDTSSENTQNESNSSEQSGVQNEGEKENSGKETELDERDAQMEVEDTDTQNETDNNQIQTDTDEKDQEKAISFVTNFLRDRNKWTESENDFLLYDGEIKGYIIVRYSTLVSGHSSTNGRYAVDLSSEAVVDITANPDFLNELMD
ncbi:hypothetical protein [Sediminibacillus terrae]|uniref:hypothetical protein n=1 Tax=Sediminibacillus terrae TaxID=1562106 RepID=UPI001294EE25|nr:hypothetical protein [Sediminibacillus terrae]